MVTGMEQLSEARPTCAGMPGRWQVEEADRLPMGSGTTFQHCAMAVNVPTVFGAGS